MRRRVMGTSGAGPAHSTNWNGHWPDGEIAQPRRTNMYVDGFVVPVRKKRLNAYIRMAKLPSRIWKDHGAVSVHESVADDVKPGKWTSFPRSVKLKRDETVVFSWIVYKSRAHRD